MLRKKAVEVPRWGLLSDIERHMMAHETFRYGDMCRLFNAVPHSRDREIDGTIQRWKKRGWITFKREGKNVVWRKTNECPTILPPGA